MVGCLNLTGFWVYSFHVELELYSAPLRSCSVLFPSPQASPSSVAAASFFLFSWPFLSDNFSEKGTYHVNWTIGLASKMVQFFLLKLPFYSLMFQPALHVGIPRLCLFRSVSFIFRKGGFGPEVSCLNGKEGWMLFQFSVMHMGFHNKPLFVCLYVYQFLVGPLLVNRRANRQTPIHRAEEDSRRYSSSLLSCHILFNQNWPHRLYFFSDSSTLLNMSSGWHLVSVHRVYVTDWK